MNYMTSRDTRWEVVNAPSPRRRAERLAGEWLATYRNLHTRKARRQDIKQWFAYLETLDVDDPIREPRRGHFETWARSLEDAGRKPGTVEHKLSAASMFYKYLLGEEIIDRDPTIAVTRPKVSKDSPRDYLTERELADIVTEAELEGGYPHALIRLLAYNGLRISETLNCDLSNLGRDRHHTTLTVIRKGGKIEAVPLPGPTVTALQTAVGDRMDGPLLLNTVGKRMDREAAAKIIRRLCRKARIVGKNITPHSFRHSSITAYVRSGASIDEAAAFAGHEDYRTTKRYVRMSRSHDAHGAYSLVSTIEHYRR